MRALLSVPAISAILLSTPAGLPAQEPDATAIVRAAIDHWRGESSYSEMTMIIHRPDWERRMSMRAWTRGEENSLVRVTAPPQDVGNGTLLDGDEMWTYSPRVNRVIKVPSSMMSQSWMGSDFSNKDVSRADDIVEEYDHRLIERRTAEGRDVWVIEATPKEHAAVVWGRELLEIRDDYLLLEHRYFDQDGVLVKTLETLEIAEMDGRSTAKRQRMVKAEAAEEWTEIRLEAVDYGVELADGVFTLSNLRNPRD